MTLAFERVTEGALFSAEARFAEGCSVVVGANAAPLATLIALACGETAPKRGRVALDGAEPHRTPASRQRTASLLERETLPSGRDVVSSLARVLAARGEAQAPHELLRSFGLEAWAKRAPTDLDAAERRSLALGIALNHDKPRLLALYEPFTATHGLAPELVRERVLAAAAAGAIVIVATSSYDDARALGGATFQIDAGVLRPAGSALGPLDAPCLLRVRTPEPGRLVAALSGDPAIAAVRWDTDDAPFVVRLHGNDLEALALALARAATAHAIAIDALGQVSSMAFRSAMPGAPTAAAADTSYAGSPTAPGAPPLDAARPPDQSVQMPTEFAAPVPPPPAKDDR